MREMKATTQSERVGVRRTIRNALYNLRVRLHERFGRKKKASSLHKRRRGERVFYYTLVAFPLLQFLVFYVGVNLNSILLSFKEYTINSDGTGGYGFVGLANYKLFLSNLFTNNDNLARIAGNSMIFYAFGLLVGLPFALFFSFYLYKRFALSGVFKVLLFLPSIVSSVVVVLMYLNFVEINIPVMAEKLFGKKIMPPLSDSTTQLRWIIFYNLFISFGTSVVMYTSAMCRIPESVVESARLDGAGYLRELVSISIPLIFPTITTFLVVGIAGIFTNQANLFTFFGVSADPDVQTFGYYLFCKVMAGRSTMSDFPYASSAGILFTLVAVPVTLLAKKLLERFGPSVEY